MKIKFKCFTFSDEDSDKDNELKVNKWLKSKDIEIVKIIQSSAHTYNAVITHVSIFYTEK